MFICMEFIDPLLRSTGSFQTTRPMLILELSLFQDFKQDKARDAVVSARMCRVGDLLLYQFRPSQGPLF